MIYYFDPLDNPAPNELQGCLLHATLFQGSVIINLQKRVQNDKYNCGPWVIEAARGVIENDSIPEPGFDISQARREHMAVIERTNGLNHSP